MTSLLWNLTTRFTSRYSLPDPQPGEDGEARDGEPHVRCQPLPLRADDQPLPREMTDLPTPFDGLPVRAWPMGGLRGVRAASKALSPPSEAPGDLTGPCGWQVEVPSPDRDVAQPIRR